MVDPERIVEGERLDGPARAADGGYVPGACNTMGDFIRSLEDGQFDSDAFEALRELAAAMQEHAWRNGGKSKGKLTISVDFVQDGGVTQMKSAFKVALPELPRAKSIMWLTRITGSPGHGRGNTKCSASAMLPHRAGRSATCEAARAIL